MDRRGGRAGFRGGSRGGSRGGFGSRGGSAGGRGRGAPRGRGRGRGRGRTNADVPRSAKFDDSRLASKSDDEMESGSEEESSEDEDDVMDVDSDDEDEEDDIQPGKPYTSLLKSLVESNPHKAKRRKLDHPTEEAEQSKPQPQSDDEDGQEKGAVDVDEVDEPEEDPTNIAPEDLFDEDDDLDATDPFETHFSNPNDKIYPRRVKAAEQAKWKMQRQPFESTRAYWSYPETGDEVPLPGPMSSVADLKLKKRLKDSIESKLSKFDATEKTIAPFLYNYRDLLYCNRTVAQGDNLRRLVALHALNHIFKTRDRVIKNNAKLSKAADGNDQDLELRDQGFTRPKVLVILPTRQSCVKFVDAIISICEPDQQENRKRFDDGYIDKSGKFSDDKPQDFRDLFGGNDDDMFRLGLKFTRKTVKYFSQFYNSDIIFASPLGLRMAIGSEEEKKKVDFDFLSSIEMVIVDQADALLMQNWEHVEFIFEHLNIQPRDAHGCDFSRVRSWYLDDQAKYFRQTVVLSAFNAPELAELMRAHCHNWAGKVRLQLECPGMIQHLPVKAKQTFSRFDSTSVAADPDARFAYFTKAIVPTLTKRNAKDAAGTLIFIPSYLDFVRVRNFFANSPIVESVSFGNISEYADIPEASRARSHFLTGRHKVLLYTERAHHFRRYQIKGVKRVVFYALPDNPVFYQEIAGGYLAKSEQSLLLEPGQGQVRVMFSKYDVMKLERVVGTSRVGRMLKEVGDTFDFV